jgi:hypothetical protein
MKNNNRFKTEIEDAIAVGDQVQLHGIVNADGTPTVREIEKSDDPGDDNGNSNASNDNSNHDNDSDDNSNAGNSNDDSDDNSNENDSGSGSNSGPSGG